MAIDLSKITLNLAKSMPDDEDASEAKKIAVENIHNLEEANKFFVFSMTLEKKHDPNCN